MAKKLKQEDLRSVIISGIVSLLVSLVIGLILFNMNLPFLTPNNPRLRVFLNTNDNAFWLPDLIKNGQEISLCVYNEGKGISGHIYLEWNYQNNISWLPREDINFNYLEGGIGNCTYDISMVALCGNSSYKMPCQSPTDVSNAIGKIGKYDVTVFTDCMFCVPKRQNHTLEICIYYSNKTQDCSN
jgi:hypothetical protein